MASSGILRLVALVITEVSEELCAYSSRATRIVELGATLTENVMKDALSSSETSVVRRSTRRDIPEDSILHSHRRENLKSYTVKVNGRRGHVACMGRMVIYSSFW
jgi:hypothetical protein